MSRKGLTTSQLFGLSPEERTALINTVAGEAYQQGGGKDIAAVTANLLSRRVANYDGMKNMVDLVMAPGQYAANDYTSRDQIINPGLISAYDRERIGKIVDNPSMVMAEYIAGGGPVSFRGTSLYKNRRGDEYTPIEGKSNFYFDPLKTQNPEAYQRGLSMFEGVTPGSGYDQTPTQTAAAATTDKITPKFDPNDFIKQFLMEQIKGINKNSLLDNLMDESNSGGYINAEQAMSLFGGFE